MEGCEDCKLGMLAYLTDCSCLGEKGESCSHCRGQVTRDAMSEVVDLNGRCGGITIERLIGERSKEELLDCNESQATVGEIVSIGKSQKLVTATGGSGRRYTSRPRPKEVSCNVKQETVLEDATRARLRVEAPRLPDALPRFTVKATVEVTLKDGSKKVYAKEVEIDVRKGAGARLRTRSDTVCACVFIRWGSVAQSQAAVRALAVDKPDLSRWNAFYVSNRSPLQPRPLLTLPIGAVRPRGWLGKQLRLQADGFHGHLGEISCFLRKRNNAWLSPQGLGANGWEEVPYWLKGYGSCAYVLGDEKMIGEAKIWIEGMLGSRKPAGILEWRVRR